MSVKSAPPCGVFDRPHQPLRVGSSRGFITCSAPFRHSPSPPRRPRKVGSDRDSPSPTPIATWAGPTTKRPLLANKR